MFNNNNNNNSNNEGVDVDVLNTSGHSASNNQGLGSSTPNIVTTLNFSTPEVHCAYGTATRSAARPLAPTQGEKDENSIFFSPKNSSVEVLSRLRDMDASVLNLLVNCN